MTSTLTGGSRLKSRLFRYLLAVAVMSLMTYGFPMWNGDAWEVYHIKGTPGGIIIFALLALFIVMIVMHAAMEWQRVKSSGAKDFL